MHQHSDTTQNTLLSFPSLRHHCSYFEKMPGSSRPLHQTLAFMWEIGRYFEPRRSADAQFMLLDGALKIHSKGTPAIFAITRSFLPPSSSFCPAKCSAPVLSIPWSYLSKSLQDSTSHNEAQITPLRRTAGTFSHERLLPQSTPGEQTAILKASGVSVARSSKPPIPDCGRVVFNGFLYTSPMSDALLSSRYPDHSRTEGSSIVLSPFVSPYIDSWEFVDGALLCGPIQYLSIMEHRRLFGGPVGMFTPTDELPAITIKIRPTADRFSPVRGFWMIHSTSCTLDCETIEHANHKAIPDTDTTLALIDHAVRKIRVVIESTEFRCPPSRSAYTL
ncbi:hypothetical protein B0H19DRAFT_1083876 [Mycena capillaripes]|nr:hypothetical protein B0H19DRAFT_1083876 [Mycena capillaripes]